jgi:hypothetical protein
LARFAVPCETTAAIQKPVEKPNERRRNSGAWDGMCLAGSAGYKGEGHISRSVGGPLNVA